VDVGGAAGGGMKFIAGLSRTLDQSLEKIAHRNKLSRTRFA